MSEAFTMIGASFTLIMLLMVALWVVYFFQRNAGIIDFGWVFGFLIASWSYFFLGHGNLLKMMIVTAMATIWAVRLLAHLYQRYDAGKEDPRYTRIREKWSGDSTGTLFLMMFIFQGLLIIIVSLPIFFVNYGSYAYWTSLEFIGMLIWLIGVGGEYLADKQLAEFKKHPENQGQVCKKGLWRFSRHPNYFFDFLVWIGFFLFALPAYGGIFAVISPVVMLLLFLKVSGIPPSEEQALASKGELYRDYQQSTSAFFPWFPKK
jgi:steroid 5-alpha reductase family enzyme